MKIRSIGWQKMIMNSSWAHCELINFYMSPLRPDRKLWRLLNLKGIRLLFRDNRTVHLSTLGQSGLVFCKDRAAENDQA